MPGGGAVNGAAALGAAVDLGLTSNQNGGASASGVSPPGGMKVGGVAVEDLLSGLNEWRNIQDIVRVTFKALHDVVKAQGEAIRALERAVASKANSDDVTHAVTELQRLIEARHVDVVQQMETKASVSDLRSELQIKTEQLLGELRAVDAKKISNTDA